MTKMTDAAAEAAWAAAMAPDPGQPARIRLEDDLRKVVLAECERLKLRTYHVPRATRSGIRGTARGWPDLIIASGNGLLARELKSWSGSPRSSQTAWLWCLRANGIDAGVWRPSDWYDGTIKRELEAIAGD